MNEESIDSKIQALEILMDLRNQAAHGGVAWAKLNNAVLYAADIFWAEVRERYASSETRPDNFTPGEQSPASQGG